MADFPLKLRVISCDNGLTRLSTMGGHEFSVPAQSMPRLVNPAEIIELPLGSITEAMDATEKFALGMALIGCNGS
jgi:hypothetical protein